MSNSKLSKNAHAHLKTFDTEYLALNKKISAPLSAKNSMNPELARILQEYSHQMDLDFNAMKAKLAADSKKLNKLQGLFDKVRTKAMMLRKDDPEADGLAWKPIKETLARYDIVASKFKKIEPRLTAAIMELPEKIINGYGQEKMIELHHFMIQAVRIPIKEKPTLQKILQIALNLGQYEGLVGEPDIRLVSLNIKDYLEADDIVHINEQITDEIMDNIVRISVLQ